MIILNRIKNFEQNNKIIIEEQFGFQERKCTVQQLARITNHISNNFNIKHSTAMVLLDIEKAFDTVWHQGLLYKLHMVGISPYIIKIILHYLKNRSFSVKIKNTLSDKQNISAGVPQGSILGPKLFCYYINDIPIDNDTKTALFADDTAIYRSSSNKKYALDKVQTTLNNFLEFFNKWKIKINESKTELIFFTKRFKKIKKGEENLELKINNVCIKPSNVVKYLGMLLDDKLTHKQHIEKACSKAYQIKNLWYPLIRAKSKLSIKNKILLYKAMIKPILLYASPIWSNAAKSSITKIQRVQNKILRFINNGERGLSNRHIREKLNVKDLFEEIYDRSHEFYNIRVKQHNILKDIGTLTADTAPFKIKYKLPHSLLLR